MIAEKETSIVRENLMTRAGYSPYCGSENCRFHWPRTQFVLSDHQFHCGCGWVSSFPIDFIARYCDKWNLPK